MSWERKVQKKPTWGSSTQAPQESLFKTRGFSKPVEQPLEETALKPIQFRGTDTSHLDHLKVNNTNCPIVTPRVDLSSLQAKLTVGAPGDKYEQEADAMASQVMSMPDAAVQRETVGEEQSEEVRAKPLSSAITPLLQREAMPEEELQAKPLNAFIQREALPEEEVQAKLSTVNGGDRSHLQLKSDAIQTGGNIESQLSSSKGGGSPLGNDVRGFMEPRFGHDFNKVRVHTGGDAVQMNRELGAQAFAHGSDIYFGAGKSPGNNELTAHELTHVVQQQQSERAALPDAGATVGVVQRDVLPVAKFSPSPGLFVDRTDKSVNISGAMELHGLEANIARATSIQDSINTTWTRTFPDGYSVNCTITVTYCGKKSNSGNVTQIEAAKILGPSHVSMLGRRSMTLNANEPDAFTWTSAHEFGHIIGLKDRYSETIMSKIKGSIGGERTNTVQAGYDGNLMAVDKGALESKNVKDIAEENEPSSYWINDDNQVRDWVNGHSLSDIGKLSTGNKLKAINTLMGGWISDDDVSAIARICSSVTSSTEANAIRSGVDLLNMTSLGQRSMVRMAFAKMP